MTVGAKFNDPATQAAIIAQSSPTTEPAATPAPEVKPAVTPAAEPVPAAQPTPEPAAAPTQTPEPAPAATEPPATEVNLDITKDIAAQKPAAATEVVDLSSADGSLDVDLTGLDSDLASAGLNRADVLAAINSNDGKFPQHIIDSLKAKFDPKVVDANVRAIEAELKLAGVETTQRAQAVADMNKFIFSELASGDATQGEQNFKVLKDWCRDNMSNEDIDAVNQMLRSTNKKVVKTGLEMAVSQWKGASKPTMMTGDAPNQPTRQALVPLSKDEFKEIMKTEKYQTDTAYAAEIDNRRRATQKTETWTPPGYHAPPVQ